MATASITLLYEPGADDGAEATFSTVLHYIATAQTSIDIHMFVWRNDDIGNRIGKAVLAAAERGVKVRIIKDVGAFMYERIEMNRKSFFNIPIATSKRLTYKALQPSFPDTYCQDDYTDALGQQLMAHTNVEMVWVNHTHTKYYIFDNQVMITGSINIEDRHRGYYDYMVMIDDADIVSRFHSRNQLECTPDLARPLEFLLNKQDIDEPVFEIKPYIIEQLTAAQESVIIEMAYIGDPDVNDAIAESADRGVAVEILFSKEANIGNDINYKTIHELYERANITVYRTNKMIHSKLMMLDHSIVVLGSANLSVFSMQKADELDIVVRNNDAFVQVIGETLKRRISESDRVESIDELADYNRTVASLQQLHQKLNDLFN
jgi:cardiolipin synthase